MYACNMPKCIKEWPQYERQRVILHFLDDHQSNLAFVDDNDIKMMLKYIAITESVLKDLTDLTEYLGGLESSINSDPTEKWAKRWASTIKRWKDTAYQMWMRAED